MSSVAMILSLLPLAFYFLFLGIIHASRRPVLLSGDEDLTILSAAVYGMIIVGPMNLFFPVNAAVRFGTYIWHILAILYVLITILIILYSRPRLIIYNIDKTSLKEILEKIARNLDEQSTWAGDSLYMPQLNLNLHLEYVSGLKNVTLVSNDRRSSRIHWRTLKRQLKSELKQTTVSRNGLSLVLFALSAILLLIIAVTFLS